MKLFHKIIFLVLLVFLAWMYLLPWSQIPLQNEWLNTAIQNSFLAKRFTLWLDLQGGVELDYKVDLTAIKTQSWMQFDENSLVEWLKKIIDTRVSSLNLSEPNIQTTKYGDETHIIVQIPTQDYGNLSESEKYQKTLADIQKAKEVIWKVVKLEFREQKWDITEEDKIERRLLAESALKDLSTTPFETVGTKYRDQFENVLFASGTGALPQEATFSGVANITTFPYRSGIVQTKSLGEYTIDENNQPLIKENTGYAIVDITGKTGTGTYTYSYIFFDQRASQWKPAKTADGKILNDVYLLSAGTSITPGWSPQVELMFNDEGKKIFAELTKRLIGKPIAIFVGGELLTAPVVQSVILDGRAVITGQYTIQSAKALADDINTGIVPAPIYLTSERTIDAKIGSHALREILIAGAVWLAVIIVFLVAVYRVSGLLAGVALIIYTILLIALVKFFGPVLTLASIAGIILSIGLAIDANILIFERMREVLAQGNNLEKAVEIGFRHSWTAIWDSHVTSLVSALILFMFGISLIKGFGLMLGLGIVLSLFTAMWVSRVLIALVAKKMTKHIAAFIGYSAK
jgi:protein-export membrane protein SecD